MKHLGDITKINGAEIEPVDCITGGSPCQDLSVAGKRAGLAGERSGLFMEQIRIVKEMREHDRRIRGTDDDFRLRPRYMVWENVPGAFSSNKGKDFQAVLTEIVRIAEPDTPDVPLPEKDRWSKSGCLYDELGGWSVAWRVHDAQFWGVPQRRKRIALVADFGGLSAPEILFERKGLSWDSDEGEPAREEAAAGAGGGAPGTIAFHLTQDPIASDEITPCFSCGNSMNGQATVGVFSLHQNASGEVRESDIAYTIGTTSNASGRNTPMVYDARGNGDGQTVCTLTGDHQNRVTDYTALCIGNGQANQSVDTVVGALNTMHDQQAVMVSAIVRRLTPLECERLQGYPDGWTDIGEWVDSKGKKHKESDSPRYKALGNSIAVGYANNGSGFWMWLLKRISAQYERNATLGSLFDGIGGFPLAWEHFNGKGSARWASEIEEFPIAVTKKHFPED